MEQRVQRHREKMRRQGMRPVQFWLPDVRTDEFRREAERASCVVAEADRLSGDMDFVEAISVLWDPDGDR